MVLRRYGYEKNLIPKFGRRNPLSLMTSSQAEKEAVMTAARLIMAAITTAPKGRGVSEVTSVLLRDEEKERLARAMEEQNSHKVTPVSIFKRDAQNSRKAAAVLLIGVKGTMPKKPEMPFNCGACGYPSCGGLIIALPLSVSEKNIFFDRS